jgi:hypothetical protein
MAEKMGAANSTHGGIRNPITARIHIWRLERRKKNDM